MSRRLRLLVALSLVSGFWHAVPAHSQCKNHSIPLPFTAMKAASKPRNFVRFKYSLSPSDTLKIRSHEDTETSIGPYDLGFAIERDGKTMQSVTLPIHTVKASQSGSTSWARPRQGLKPLSFH